MKKHTNFLPFIPSHLSGREKRGKKREIALEMAEMAAT